MPPALRNVGARSTRPPHTGRRCLSAYDDRTAPLQSRLRARASLGAAVAAPKQPMYAHAMPVQVKWFPTLIKRTKSKQPMTTVDWRDGLTPGEIFRDEGFSAADAEAVMVVINSNQQDMETALKDGDELEFMVSIQGG